MAQVENEAERLSAVRRYDVLDSPPDGAFDRITALAARYFDVPIAIVSVVDEDRIWFMSHHGLEATETGRDPGLCASAILQYQPWIVENAAVDARTLANPLVAGQLGLRFYAGVPLTTDDGFNLGTLCVIDQQPRRFSSEETAALEDMARIVMDELELRLAAHRVIDQEHELRHQAERTAQILQASLLPPTLPRIPGATIASVYLPAAADVVGGDFYDAFRLADGAWAIVIGDVTGKGPKAAAVTALARNAVRTASLTGSGPAEILAIANNAMLIGVSEAQVESFCTVLIAYLHASLDGFTVTVGSAGHPPALVLRANGEVEELVGSSGPPLGWYGEAEFATCEAVLKGSDALVLYTDGLSEARTEGTLVGVEGIIKRLKGEGKGADVLAERLADILSSDAVAASDDAAAIVLTVH